MILKRDLLKGIDTNTEQIVWQGQMIEDLKERIEILENKLAKSSKAKEQPRDKSGKFSKKK